MNEKIVITEIKRTSSEFPSQWEFKTEDNRIGYIRYRHGDLKICLSLPGQDLDDAINRMPIMTACFGDRNDGTLSNVRMIYAVKLLDFDISNLEKSIMKDEK